MPFLSLTLNNFRNLDNSMIDLLSKEVYFIGENGQGKSNLLESIYMASYGSSFRTHSDNEIIRNGEKNFSLRCLFKEESGKTDTVFIKYDNGKKSIEKNAKSIKDRKELINTIPCVLFCHDDLDFAIGEPERRRFFIDQSLSMYDPVYIDILRKYKRILKSRNSILKDPNYNMLDIYDIPLITEGLQIQKKRRDTINQFNTIFTQIYYEVTGIENVSVSYEPSWKSDKIDEVSKILLEKRESDKLNCITMTGPHRDRIKFIKNGKPFIPTASTGQRRLSALILRIGQATYFTEVTGKKPILLMDDVLLELDPDKRQKITTLLPEYDQLFCTFLPGEPYERYKHSTTKVYNIKQGKWNE